MKEDAIFYVGQKAFIYKEDQVLVLKGNFKGLDYPGGKIQEGETDLKESLKREVREETGLEIIVEDPFSTWATVFPDNHRLGGKRLFLVGYKCKYISGEVTLSNEHDSFLWVDKKNYVSLDDKSSYFEILKKYFLNK